MPWHTSGRFAFSPINIASHKPYRGINTVCLWAAAQSKDYESGEWGTYQQWQERGAQVRKGEKATLVVFWKFQSATWNWLVFVKLGVIPPLRYRPANEPWLSSWE